jgi:hypothetical protein
MPCTGRFWRGLENAGISVASSTIEIAVLPPVNVRMDAKGRSP